MNKYVKNFLKKAKYNNGSFLDNVLYNAANEPSHNVALVLEMITEDDLKNALAHAKNVLDNDNLSRVDFNLYILETVLNRIAFNLTV